MLAKDTADERKIEILQSVKGVGAVTISKWIAELPSWVNSIEVRSPSSFVLLPSTVILERSLANDLLVVDAVKYVACCTWRHW